MAQRSPKHGLTKTIRGWVKRVNSVPKWIVSDKVAPTPQDADDYYTQNFTNLWQPQAQAADGGAVAVDDLCDFYLSRQRQRIGRRVRGITQRTCDEYFEALQAFCDHVPKGRGRIGAIAYRDLTSDDFASFYAYLSERFGVDRFRKFVVIVRSLFKMLAKPPARLLLPDYGEQFSLPTKKDERLSCKAHKEKHGPKLFAEDEILVQLVGRRLTAEEMTAAALRRKTIHRGVRTFVVQRIRPAGRTQRAMIYAAINCGFGNTDLAELPLSVARAAIKSEWIDYERGKTGARRLAWLWPETRRAWIKYLAVRPEPASGEHAGLFFLNSSGRPYIAGKEDQIIKRYDALLERLGQKRLQRNFYSLRRTYRSIAAEVGKELVIDLSMGHAKEDMARVYTVAELRGELKKIALHVRHRILIDGLSAAFPTANPAAAVSGSRGAA